MTVIWAAVIASIAWAGPWRRDPLGPPGVVAAVTVGVIALDVMTGSRLQMGTPFGLSALVAGRFYGIGNNAVEIYGASGILCAAWIGAAALRHGSRGRAVAAAGAVAPGRRGRRGLAGLRRQGGRDDRHGSRVPRCCSPRWAA